MNKIIMLVLVILSLVLVGCSNIENTEGETPIASACYGELCEYSKDGLSFTAPCNIITDLINREFAENSFEEHMLDTINEFENNCEDFVALNLYYNFRASEDYNSSKGIMDMTIEEFKEDDEINPLIKWSCDIN